MEGLVKIVRAWRYAALSALALVWIAQVGVAGEVRGRINLGDTVLGTIDVPGEDIVVVKFVAVKDTALTVKAKAGKGSTLEPTLALKDAANADIDLGETLVLNGTKADIKKFVIPATGEFKLVIGGAAGAGDFEAKTSAKVPTKYTLPGSVPDAATVSFDVLPGSTIKAQVKADKGSTLLPIIDGVSDSGGALELVDNTFKKTTAKFKSALAEDGGTCDLVVSGDQDTAGAFTAKISVKAPKSKETVDLTTVQPIGTLAGIVTNALTEDPLAGVAVSVTPAVDEGTDVTDETGAYSIEVPAGTYDVTFEEPRFNTETRAGTAVAASTVNPLDVAMTPTVPVIVKVVIDGDPAPDGTVTATAELDILDGSTPQTFAWSQSNSVAVEFATPAAQTTDVTFPDAAAFKDELLVALREPPITAEQLPPNVPVPDEAFAGGLPTNRFMVVGLNPFQIEEAGLVDLKVTVTTSSGEYTGEGETIAALDWKPTAGVQNVPVGIRVLLNGKDDLAAYNWALSAKPAGSAAVLNDATTQNPDFTPDVSGAYAVTVTDTSVEPPVVVNVPVIAGEWAGAITGQDAQGLPLADGCTGCHNGTLAPDNFTPWRESGHAEIFTDMLNTNTHYGEGCFACHTVGFDLAVANNGFDDASDYDAFLTSGLINNPGDNWTTMLADYPVAAKLGNIQCENCHGPNDSPAHTQGDVRMSLSSDMCGQCHGEPLRHGRFQQWQLSGHANYELAVEEGESGSCSRCHTANGFLTWLPVLLDDDPATDPLADITVTWTADQIHPQTCVTCHDPHDPGSVSGNTPDTTVRITGDTPPLIAGFTATDVGSGAICMTCHNTRRGLKNDSNYDPASNVADRAPHPGAQADMLMSQNAYLVTVGTRGSHSITTNVEDTCVTCHMEKTPPPDVLSYNGGGYNHTFYASNTICAECHEGLDASAIQGPTETKLVSLKAQIIAAITKIMTDQIAAGNKIELQDADGLAVVTITDMADVEAIDFLDESGRQAITVTIDGTVSEAFRLDRVDVISPTPANLGSIYDPTILGTTYADLPKCGWNWCVVESDSSEGVHNPTFITNVLNASIAALPAAAP